MRYLGVCSNIQTQMTKCMQREVKFKILKSNNVILFF
jgi:hypothetical protein